MLTLPDARNALKQAAESYGTPYYLYFEDVISHYVARIRQAFGDTFGLSYAVKANPNVQLLAHIAPLVDQLDVSSLGEVKHARSAGFDLNRVSFTGPAKRPDELECAAEWGVGEIIVESVAEAVALSKIAQRRGQTIRILARISPTKVPDGFGVNMAGKPTQFGIDEEEAVGALGDIQALPALQLEGLHIYAGTQCLDAAAIGAGYCSYAQIFERLCQAINLRPNRLIFGSGLGVAYHPGDEEVDLQRVAQGCLPTLRALREESTFCDTQLLLETGRYLVGEAGVFVTRVIRTKQSRGKHFAICDGGMNNHLAACGLMGSVVHRNYRIGVVDSGRSAGLAPQSNHAYNLVGPLCTTVDTLARRIELPELKEGDLIAISPSGAYGLSASPTNFISHPPPAEIWASGPVESPQLTKI